MFSRVRRHFTYANVAMTLALVFAMTGGAYAANRYLITSTKQIKPSVLKQLTGRSGANGAQGPAGAAGVAGAQGTAGSVGPQGPAGTAGAKGETGPQGPEGKPGEPGTTGFTETLPSGKVEEGVWTIVFHATGASQPGATSISFPIPLASGVTAHFITIKEQEEGKLPVGCFGSAKEPGALKGNLCVFVHEYEDALPYQGVASLVNPETGESATAGKMGVEVLAQSKEESTEGNVVAAGTWAVSAS